MNRLPTEIAAVERARWLAELAEALEQAERVVWSLGDLSQTRPEILELYGSLDAARAEVQALRSRRVIPHRANLQPFWADSSERRGC